MLYTVKKYNVCICINALAISVKKKLKKFSVWYSIGAEKLPREFMEKGTTKCLIKNHKIRKTKH